MAGENINHFNSVRLRVKGSGNLKLKFLSLDEVLNQQLVDLPMVATTYVEPLRLANFIKQKASLEVRTTEKDEIFSVNRIVISIRQLYTEYPA